MRTDLSTQTWGYKLLPGNKLNFYHILLPRVSESVLPEYVSSVSLVEKIADGSIVIHLKHGANIYNTIKDIVQFFQRKSLEFFETPKNNYKIPTHFRQQLLTWSLAFEGCLAFLLLSDEQLTHTTSGKWEYINASTGGLFLSPFTLFLYEDYAKVVHPITLPNYNQRLLLEQKTQKYIRLMFKRMLQAEKGMEGIALLALVEERTGFKQQRITEQINAKSFQIKARTYSSFFTQF